MTIRDIGQAAEVPGVPDGRMVVQGLEGPKLVGHAHFWERALSRRQLLRGAAGAAGATALTFGTGLTAPTVAAAKGRSTVEPKPIPGGLQPGGPGTEVFHLFLPGLGAEPSTITDFAGFVGIAEVQGTGLGFSPGAGKAQQLLFDIDTRFMQGTYVGVDGNTHQGTFAFI